MGRQRVADVMSSGAKSHTLHVCAAGLEAVHGGCEVRIPPGAGHARAGHPDLRATDEGHART